MKKGNMYSLSVKQWNPYVGCEFHCTYCKPSFQRMLKRYGKKHCQLCYDYQPHEHLDRLYQALPRTRYMQFIFTCSTGDISFCNTQILRKILERIHNEPDKTFLIQSKDPSSFNRVKFPENVILGTTIETNRRALIEQVSDAPSPLFRVHALEEIDHPLKMLTYEPILDFDRHFMVSFAERIKPCMIWLGYDSKPKENQLPEPPLEKVKRLHWELAKGGFTIMLKTIRTAWNQT